MSNKTPIEAAGMWINQSYQLNEVNTVLQPVTTDHLVKLQSTWIPVMF